MFQLILNPIRDWNETFLVHRAENNKFQLILNPIRDWNKESTSIPQASARSN